MENENQLINKAESVPQVEEVASTQVKRQKFMKDVVEKVEEEIKFEVSSLRKYCKELFDVSTIVFDGAFHKMEGSFSKTEATEIIKNFLNKVQG